MPLDRAFIEASLATLEENLRFLKELSGLSEEEFTADKKACYSAAYALMISIEALAGICSHIISSCGIPTPSGMADSFQKLHDSGILRDSEQVQRLKSMSRFRNLIVHRYWKVDYSVVHDILINHLADFEGFAVEIVSYLDSQVG